MDENNIDYIGNSQVCDYAGDIRFRIMDAEVGVIELDKESLVNYREKFPVYKSADSFRLG
jgi:hypothetical protein